jgi:NADPH:quinone reductase-like Zn-dependent oxidoreductase
MKSIQIKSYGSSDVMEVKNTESVLSPPPGKILVNVKAAGVNPVDWKIREGYMQQIVPLQFPSTLAMDFSGVIKQVGER